MSYKKLTRSIVFTSLLTVFPFFTTAIADDDENLAVDNVEGSLSIMVLGSGAPLARFTNRASAGYLIFIDGEAKVLMDAGGGTFARLAESGANIKDLDIILLTHLHIDHMGELSPMIKNIYFQSRIANLANGAFPPGRTNAIRIFGPDANGVKFPKKPDGTLVLGSDSDTTQYTSTTEYVDGHYNLKTGLERYLNIFTRGISGGIFSYSATNLSPNWLIDSSQVVLNENGLVITSIGVNHGPVPSVAYRIEYAGKTIVFSGDTSSRSVHPVTGAPLPNGGNMIKISEGADLLIYDTSIMNRGGLPNGPNDSVFFALHTQPSRIGQVATTANVKKLVLSHITLSSEDGTDQIKGWIKAEGFTGEISVAKDLKVYNLDH